MERYFQKKDLLLVLACGLVAALSLAVGSHYFYRAFPEASIDFKITREQARDQALGFLQERGLDMEGFRHSAIFSYDSAAKTFLERELGLEGASGLIGDPVRLWTWSNRWVRELQKEEFRVRITTTGELVGFDHLVEEDGEGARLSQGEARKLAEGYLSRTLGRSLDKLEFVEAESIERRNRTDHSFTYKLADFEVNGATYRLRLGILGDQVGSFKEYLKIPEAWEREYRQLRSHNEATGIVAQILLALTMIAMLVVLFGAIRKRDVRWRTATIFGAVAAVLTLLANLNVLPLTAYGYDTTETFGSFLTGQLVGSLASALSAGIFIFFLTAAAEPVYRRAYGNQIGIGRQFVLRGLRTKRFLLGTVIGLAMTAFFLAYQTVFYLVAEKFGAWSPADIPYSEMVNTYFPWTVVLLIGFMPAVSEEFISRAFSIPFLHKYLRSRWAAIVIAAAIWGFAHAGYPQQPFFIRGLEVGIAGVVVGLVMIRWGILPALVWHYTVDALYTALILLRSSNPYFVVSAAISVGIMLLPLLLALLLYLRHRSFADPAPLLNRELDAVQSPAPAEQQAPSDAEPPVGAEPAGGGRGIYSPLSRRHVVIAAVLVLASLGVYLAPVERPLDSAAVAIDRHRAREIAAAHLGGRGIETGEYKVVAYHVRQHDSRAIKYVLEHEGVPGVNRLYPDHLLPGVWRVRFFRPLHKEEFQVDVDPGDGSVYAVRHHLEEEAPGADLGEEEARAVAAAHLEDHGLSAEEFDLKEASAEKLEARRDHRFIWEAREGDPRNVGELKYRCEVTVAGDQPAKLKRYAKLPESWVRARRESTTLRAVLEGTGIAVVTGLVLHLLWLLVRRVRGPGLAWAPLLRIGGIACAVTLIGWLNGLPTFYRGYPTEYSTAVFLVEKISLAAVQTIAIGLLVVAALAMATSLYPDWREKLRWQWGSACLRDALLAAALIFAGQRALERLTLLLQDHFAPYVTAPALAAAAGLDAWLPFWSGLGTSLGQAVALPVVLGAGIYYLRRVLRRPLYVVLAVVGLGSLFSGSGALNAGEFYLGLGLFLLKAAFFLAVVAGLLRDNIAAYILTGFLSSALTRALALLDQPAATYQAHGVVLLAVTVLVVGGLWWQARRQEPGAAW